MSAPQTVDAAGVWKADVVSVVLCTYNRANKLSMCLDRLLAMDVPDGVAWELICVDNNSTDDTKHVVQKCASKSPVPLRYVFEKTQGLSSARNAGIRHARGAIVASTDDDCVVDTTWLSAIWEEFQRCPDIGFVGGRVELYDPADLPITVRTSRERTCLRVENVFSHIAGCNIAFRRRIVDEIGLFDPDLGAGTSLMSAEDIDFVYRASKCGQQVVYVPEILVFHAHGRRTERDRKRLERGYLIGRGAFYAKHILNGDRCVLRLAYWELNRLLKSAVKRGATRERRFLGYLLLGGIRYLVMQARRRVQPKS